MLKTENYKMFSGVMTITPTKTKFYNMEPFDIEGTWLYKPEHDCWYCNGSSYPSSICKIKVDETEISKS